jgi:hypothetical protein
LRLLLPPARHGAIHFALGFPPLDVLAPIVLLLAVYQRQLHLHAAALFVERKRDQGVALLSHFRHQAVDLTPVEQQLAPPHEMTLADGRVVFVKSNSVADPTMFAAEARGLAWLAQARALRVPEVLAVDETFLVLEAIAPARRRPDFDERLGRNLAALHRFGAPGFGLDHDNFIGRLPQSNTPAASWPDFYRSRRLEPQLRLARDAGLCS